MSGIFKGDSIYKSGGGGGGYKDGGQLVDGDFIKVENNTVSSYDNVSRDPVNFYFEVKDGEVLNSVVELTTAVNATVNVYVVRNGLYYLIGNVGGNTVNAGDEYKLNVVGDSFVLEVVTPSQAVPEYVEINGAIIPVVKVGNTLWTCLDLENRFYIKSEAENFLNYSVNGFVLPIRNDFTELVNNLNPNGLTKIKTVDGWPAGYEGTNESGLSIYPYGWYNNGIIVQAGSTAHYWCVYGSDLNDASISKSSTSFAFNGSIPNYQGFRIRLVKYL